MNILIIDSNNNHIFNVKLYISSDYTGDYTEETYDYT